MSTATNSPKDTDAARGERMQYRINKLLSDPWSFLPSYANRYATLLKFAQTLTPQQLYSMTMLLGKDSSKYYPDMPNTSELQFPAVNAVDGKSQIGWYYFAGTCTATDGKRYGVLCMLFRSAIMPPVMAGEFGLSDTDNQIVEVQLAFSVEGGPFYQIDPPVTAGTSGKVKISDKFCLATEGGSAESLKDDSLFPIRLRAGGADHSGSKPVEMAIDFTFSSSKTYLLQGLDGAMPLVGGVGTKYYSIPGIVLDPKKSTLHLDGKKIELKSGTFWFDHQWGLAMAPGGSPRYDVMRASANLNPSPGLGWDFFVANFDDNRNMTLNSIHDADSLKFIKQTGPQPPGVLRAPIIGKYMDPFGVQFNVSGTLEIDEWLKTGPSPNPAKFPNNPTWVPHHWVFTVSEHVVPENLRKLEGRAITDDPNALQFANGARYVEAAIDYFGADGKRVGTGYAEAVGYVDTLATLLSLAGLPTTPEMMALFGSQAVPPALWLESFLFMLNTDNQAELKRLIACGSFPPGPRPTNCGTDTATLKTPLATTPSGIASEEILALLKEKLGLQ